MVGTRGSPQRATRSSKRGAASLPTQEKRKKKKAGEVTTSSNKVATSSSNNKAAKASTKPTKKQVDDAKKKTAEEEAKKGAPEEAKAVEVKPEPGTKEKKRRMWTEEEDKAACTAYVNVSTDPTVGAQQKGETFWKRVQKQMYELYNGSAEVADLDEWRFDSVESRVMKIIGKATSAFNGYYIRVTKEPGSGWTEQMHLDAAARLYEETLGKPFKHITCARILHRCPKFRPSQEPKEEDEDGNNDSKATSNPVASIQGKGLPLPPGTKQAKKKALIAKLDLESVASTAQTDAILAVAKSAADLTKGFEKKRKIDSMHKTVEAYIKMGMVDKAHAKLNEIENLEAAMEEDDDRKPAAVDIPLGAEAAGTEDEEAEDGESEEEEQGTVEVSWEGNMDPLYPLGPPNFMSSDESSLHPSQPSNDSRSRIVPI